MIFAKANLVSHPESPAITVEVVDAPLPIGMRLGRVRSRAVLGARPGRPRLPSLPGSAPIVPAVGVTALTMLLSRDRRQG